MPLITSPAFVFLVTFIINHLPPLRPKPEAKPSDRPYHQIMLAIWTLLPGLGLVAMLAHAGMFQLGGWPGRVNAAVSGENIVSVILPNTLLLFAIFRHIAALRTGKR